MGVQSHSKACIHLTQTGVGYTDHLQATGGGWKNTCNEQKDGNASFAKNILGRNQHLKRGWHSSACTFCGCSGSKNDTSALKYEIKHTVEANNLWQFESYQQMNT